MPLVALVGKSIAGGGVVIGPGAVSVLCEGLPVSCVGDTITSHGPDLHAFAHIIQGSTIVTAEGKPVAFDGALCSCGCTISNPAILTSVSI